MSDVPLYKRDKLCKLVSKHSGRVFDFPSNERDVLIWDDHGGKNQQVIVNSGLKVSLRNNENGLYSTVKNNPRNDYRIHQRKKNY